MLVSTPSPQRAQPTPVTPKDHISDTGQISLFPPDYHCQDPNVPYTSLRDVSLVFIPWYPVTQNSYLHRRQCVPRGIFWKIVTQKKPSFFPHLHCCPNPPSIGSGTWLMYNRHHSDVAIQQAFITCSHAWYTGGSQNSSLNVCLSHAPTSFLRQSLTEPRAYLSGQTTHPVNP